MSARALLTNARIATPRGVIDGSLAVESGRIAEILPRRYDAGLDLRGAFLMPGVIDVHTDYLEKEISPRPGAEVPLEMALHVMDLRALACGLTTVLSAARISPERGGSAGSWHGDGFRLAREMHRLGPHMRARHLVNVRWDTRYEPTGDDLAELVQLESTATSFFNDSLPGIRQFRDMDALIRKAARQLDLSFEASRARRALQIAELSALDNRAEAAAAIARRFPLGSHDDTTVEHVIEAHAYGASLCEMPVTIEAARKAKELGMLVCLGLRTMCAAVRTAETSRPRTRLPMDLSICCAATITSRHYLQARCERSRAVRRRPMLPRCSRSIRRGIWAGTSNSAASNRGNARIWLRFMRATVMPMSCRPGLTASAASR